MSSLVLTRKPQEKVVIHQNGVVIATVTYAKQMEGSAIRLAIGAEPAISIDRLEVFEAKYPTA